MFNVLAEMFDQVGLHTKAGNMINMAYQPYHTIGSHSAEAYGLRMDGEVLTHQERLLQWDHCPDFDAELVEGPLETHWKVQHRVGWGNLRATPTPPS